MGLKAIRNRVETDAGRIQAALDNIDSHIITSDLLEKFARKARERIRLDDGGLPPRPSARPSLQSQAVQIAHANSGAFVYDEPMMQPGFAALDFTPDQIGAFFAASDSL